jgi:hypothetical protein
VRGGVYILYTGLTEIINNKKWSDGIK